MKNFIRAKRLLFLLLYYGIAKWLPPSYLPGGSISKKIRYLLCKQLFRYCGKDVNIEAGAYFHGGKLISIGDRSGIGVNARAVGPIKIGKNVMMGQDVVIITRNHNYNSTDMPIIDQGYAKVSLVTIGDNVWIGDRVIILPGVTIGKEVILGAGTVVAKSIPDWAVVIGNPARIVHFRNQHSRPKYAEDVSSE